MKFSKETQFMVWVVKKAAKKMDKKIAAFEKDNVDIVTANDLKLEKFISAKMRKRFPEFTIIGEEFSGEAMQTENYFTVDPIDGTINYAKGLDMWGIQVGCVKNGERFSGVIFLPATNEFYVAEKGKGAHKNGKQIFVDQGEPKSKLVATFMENEESINFLKKVLPDDKERFCYSRKFFSCAYTNAKLAEGALGTYYFFNLKSKLWDEIPGSILVTEAGGYHYYDDKFRLVTAFKTEKERILSLYENWKKNKNG